MKANSPFKMLLLWLGIFSVIIILFFAANKMGKAPEEISYSKFVELLEEDGIASAQIKGDQIHGKMRKGTDQQFVVTIPFHLLPQNNDLLAKMVANKVDVNAESIEGEPVWKILLWWAPLVIIIVVWLFFMRQMQSGGGKAMSFGKSRAKLLTNQGNRVTFKDVAGVEEAKEELVEVIDFLKDPKKFTRLGGRIPKGVLLVGPPGTGKTLLARAIAGEANVPFFNISGSDFVEMFVGVGASRVRDLFLQGKKNAPCIIFIDEIDAVGRHRGAGLGGGHDEREQTLNQLLVEMDGFEFNEGVIIIAATNRPDVLDPALLRPGRFDRRVVVARPDIRGRQGILGVHTNKVPLDEDVELEKIARGTPGFVGADLANLVNEASLWAARHNKDLVGMKDFEYAKDKVLMGGERKSMIISDREKRNTAYHESGHALVARLLPGADPVHKVTIIPRGQALGLTQQLPEEDKYTLDQTSCENNISILMGGRIAEELVLGHTTTGAGNDIERATDLARSMVCEWGMSRLGPLTFGQKEEQIFLGREIAQHRDYSESTAVKIDEEIQRIIGENYERAYRLIEENIDILHRLAQALLDRETIDSDEVSLIVEGKTLPPLPESEGPGDDGSGSTGRPGKTGKDQEVPDPVGPGSTPGFEPV